MKERLKELRTTLDLSMEKFGNELGVSRSAISKLETGTNSLTDQMIKTICNIYNVNEDWLRFGTGSMFKETKEEFLTNMSKQYSLSDLDQKLIKAYLELTPDQREVIHDYIDKLKNS